jgi:hypothetical protein
MDVRTGVVHVSVIPSNHIITPTLITLKNLTALL